MPEAEVRTYAAGDWIVHCDYGIGQIQGIELNSVSGEERRYFKVKMAGGLFWIPVGQMDGEFIRPLSNPDDIQEAIAVLQKPPRKMSSNYKIRQNRIRQAHDRNSPKAAARLLRDLRGLRREKGILGKAERAAFRDLRQRLAEEWALVLDQKIEQALSSVDQILGLQRAAPQDAGLKAAGDIAPRPHPE